MTINAPWQNRIVGHGVERPDQMLANPHNWRIHPKAQQDALSQMLDTVGWVQDVIVNQRTGHVVDGHLRVSVAISRDEASIPVVYVDLSPEEEALVLASLDPLAAMAVTDQEMLAELMQDISPEGALEEMLRQVAGDKAPKEGLTDPDDVPDAVEPVTKLGDLWLMGEHRLLCGDSTTAEDVGRLMDGHLAQMAVTSPPYNQGIDKFTPSGMHREGDWVSKVARLAYPDSMDEESYQSEQITSLELWAEFMADGSSLFYNHKNRYRDKQVISPLQWLPGPFRLRQELVWSRPGSVTQNARMFLPSDERIYWLYKGDDFYFDDTTEIKSYSTVWAIGLETNRTHAVAYPVELPTRCITACSHYADIVFDPFLGSGTTLIACERLGRRCYAMEIEPHYVDVSVRRWEEYTGQKAVLADG